MSFHKTLISDDVHVPNFRTYANEANRLNDTPTDPSLPSVAAADVGKVARQSDDGSYWVLDGVGPLLWNRFGAGGLGAPGGLNTHVQFNDGGVFAGDPDLTWDKTGNVLDVTGTVKANTRTLDVASLNVVDIFSESDFPSDATHINLAPGTLYLIRAPITVAKQINMPDTSGEFDPAVIRAENRERNTITVTGTTGAFVTTASGDGQLFFQNVEIINTGNQPFVNVTGLTQQSLAIELDATNIVDFTGNSRFELCTFSMVKQSCLIDSGTWECIDVEMLVFAFQAFNTVDAQAPAFDVKSSSGSVIPTRSTVFFSRLSSHPFESFFFIHSNLIAESFVRISFVESALQTPGVGSFYGTKITNVTALGESPGAPGVRTIVLAAGHNVADGDTVTLSGFVGQAQYNRDYVASNVVAGVSFEVVEVFVATDTGIVTENSLTQKGLPVDAFRNIKQPNSRITAELFLTGNAQQTVIPAIGAFVFVNAVTWTSDTIERLTPGSDGSTGYDGLIPLVLSADASVTLLPITGNDRILTACFIGIHLPKRVVTFDNTTNTILEAATPRIVGETITFRGTAGTLPTGVRDDVMYFIFSTSGSGFKIAFTPDDIGEVTFTDNGSGVNSYQEAQCHGSIPEATISNTQKQTVAPTALLPLEPGDEVIMAVQNNTAIVNVIVSTAYQRILDA